MQFGGRRLMRSSSVDLGAETKELMQDAMYDSNASKIIDQIRLCKTHSVNWEDCLGKYLDNIGASRHFACNQLEGMTERMNEHGSFVYSEDLYANTPQCKLAVLRALMALSTGDFAGIYAEAEAQAVKAAADAEGATLASGSQEVKTVSDYLVECLLAMPEDQVHALKAKIARGELDRTNWEHHITTEQIDTIESGARELGRAVEKHNLGYSRAVPTEIIEKMTGGVAAPAPVEAGSSSAAVGAGREIPLGRESQVSPAAVVPASLAHSIVSSLDTDASFTQRSTSGVIMPAIFKGAAKTDAAPPRQELEAFEREQGDVRNKRRRRLGGEEADVKLGHCLKVV